jgi:hypothetical protein
VPAVPDLETAVASGRRRLRHRQAGLATAAVAAAATVVAAPLAVSAWLAHPAEPPAPAAVAQAATDFVAGTDIDDSMAATVAEHLPSLPAPDDVYPSDSHTAGPLPDAELGRAQEWQAAYTTERGGALVLMGHPEELAGWSCSGCDETAVPGGTLYHQTYSTAEGGGTWWFGTYFVADDGHFVNAFESVRAPDQDTAAGLRQLSDSQLEALVEDPRLTF